MNNKYEQYQSNVEFKNICIVPVYGPLKFNYYFCQLSLKSLCLLSLIREERNRVNVF